MTLIRAAREVTFKPLEEEPLLSTVYNVDICAVGIEYPLSSGPATFTMDDLIQAVASQEDPAVVAPRVWLGHPDDDRFHAGRATPAGSAEPAIGKVINMRVEDEGMTLVGDIAGVPTWLAKILSSAYPSRSIEGWQEATTATGRTWGLVISDLALLGVTWPGVSTLEDLKALYSEDGPDGVEVTEETMAVAAGRSVEGQVDLDDIRRAFGKAVEAGTFEEIRWPWIRAVLLDPNELIIDDDATGEIFRLPYTPDEAEGATFGELKQVKVQYVNASQKKDPNFKTVLMAGLTVGGRKIAAQYTSREESRINPTQEVTMTPAEIRASLGLPEDATDDQVKSKITELQAAAEKPSPDQVPAGGGEPSFHGPGSPGDGPVEREAATEADPTTPPVGERTNPSDGDVEAAMKLLQARGLSAVPTEAWATTQASVQRLAQKGEEDEKVVRQRTVVDALRAGKIFPSQREYYAKKVEDPSTRDAFMHLLTASVAEGGLMENTVPVHARSVDAGDTALVAEAYPAAWLPEVQQRQAPSPITTES